MISIENKQNHLPISSRNELIRSWSSTNEALKRLEALETGRIDPVELRTLADRLASLSDSNGNIGLLTLLIVTVAKEFVLVAGLLGVAASERVVAGLGRPVDTLFSLFTGSGDVIVAAVLALSLLERLLSLELVIKLLSEVLVCILSEPLFWLDVLEMLSVLACVRCDDEGEDDKLLSRCWIELGGASLVDILAGEAEVNGL